MKKIGMLFWAFGFAFLLGVLNANSAEISEGMKLYTRTNLATKGKKIYYHNVRSNVFIPIGTAVKVGEVDEKKHQIYCFEYWYGILPGSPVC